MSSEYIPNFEDEGGIPKSKGVPVSFVKRGFTTNEGLEEIIEGFRLFYMEERKAGRTDLMQIFREYRKNTQMYKKIWFNPYPNQVKGWIKNWEQSLPVHIRKVAIKGRDTVKKNQVNVKAIEYADLEDGSKNLQSLLIDDAEQLMKESNTDYELIDVAGGYWSKEEYEKTRIKKKALALSIAKEVLSGVHKHQTIQIKRNKEGRETAGFLMDLMKQATSGELSEKDLELLDNSVPSV